jgi:hypothetical protein
MYNDLSRKKAAREYLKENDIENSLCDMINSVASEKPSEPIIYIIKYLTGTLTDEEREFKDSGKYIFNFSLRPGEEDTKLDFQEAKDLAGQAVARNPYNALAYGVLCDAQIECGEITGHRRALGCERARTSRTR